MQVQKPWSPIIAEGYQEVTEMPIVCWLQCEKEQDFPIKIDRSLLIHLPSQSVDCVRQASCIQEPKSRKNLAERHKSQDLYNYQQEKLWASWQFQRQCCLMNHQTSREQLEELQMSSSGEYPQIQSLQSNEQTRS